MGEAAMAGNRSGAVMEHLRTLFSVGTVGALSDGHLLDLFVILYDESAFAALIERHGPMVHRVCRQVLGDAHDAQDAAQAVFLVLARRARSIRNRGSLASWLHGVALRTAAKARTAAARRRAHEHRAGEMRAREESDRAPGEDPSWPEVHEELDRLPEKFRQPIVLCHLEGLTREMAAQQLGWPLGTVQSRLARGQEQLRSRLIRRGVTFSAGLAAAGTASAAMSPAWGAATTRAAIRIGRGETVAAAASATAASMTRRVLIAMLIHKFKGTAIAALVCGSLAIGATTLARQLATAPADLPEGGMVGREARESGQAQGEPSTAPEVTLDEVKTALKRHREAIKGLFVRYEEEAVPLIDPDLAFRWDVMQIRMKTEEHQAFEETNRYRRTIHRGTSEALGDPTVVDPLSPKLVQERRREKAKQHEMATAEAKAKGYDPPPRIFLVGPLDYEAGYEGRRFWRRYNKDYLIFPVTREPGTFRGWQSRGEDYLQAIGLGILDPSEEGEARPAGEPSNLLPEALGAYPYRLLGRTEVVDGAACVVAEGRWKAPYNRGEVTDRLWLDGRRGFALRRRDIYRDGILERRIANGSIEEVSPGVWMPKSVEYRYASFPTVPENARGKLMVARRLKVLELRVNKIPEGLFAPRPGARVLDLTGPTTPPVDGGAGPATPQ
jgi:RNA polymerase sigma factor (sigma-70 family)